MSRDRYKRELALTVTQTTTAKRAYKHMAWAKKKELRERIKKLKAEEDMLKSLSVLEPYSEFGEHYLLIVGLKMVVVMVIIVVVVSVVVMVTKYIKHLNI